MNANMENRVARLETLAAPDDRMTIVVSFVWPGTESQPEPIGASSNGWNLTRGDGEALETFIARLTAVAPRNEWGAAVVVLEYPEEAMLH